MNEQTPMQQALWQQGIEHSHQVKALEQKLKARIVELEVENEKIRNECGRIQQSLGACEMVRKDNEIEHLRESLEHLRVCADGFLRWVGPVVRDMIKGKAAPSDKLMLDTWELELRGAIGATRTKQEEENGS